MSPQKAQVTLLGYFHVFCISVCVFVCTCVHVYMIMHMDVSGGRLLSCSITLPYCLELGSLSELGFRLAVGHPHEICTATPMCWSYSHAWFFTRVVEIQT